MLAENDMLDPLMKFCAVLRGMSHGAVDEKSSQRGMVTAQSHCLYALAQSSQLRAREYCALDVVLQGICWRE